MTIYTRWGGECKIVAQFGMQKPDYFEHALNLVLVRHQDGDNFLDRFYWADLLKSDDGWQEIETAMKEVPEYYLNDRILRAVFKEAE